MYNNEINVKKVYICLLLSLTYFVNKKKRFQMFTKDELIDMILIIGESTGIIRRAKRIYRERFPRRRQPSLRTLRRIFTRFRETGSVEKPKRNTSKVIINEVTEIMVLASVHENPHVSTRNLSNLIDISQSSASRILRKNKFHPYHINLTQELHGEDFNNRVRFCNWAMENIRRNPQLLSFILFTDEATFKSNGCVNRHNMHYYATENPHWMRNVDSQRVWSLNVWGGIIGDFVVGPHFFEGPLNGDNYLNFLIMVLPELLEDIPLNVHQNLIFQHDGAPPHYARNVRNYLNNQWREQWIGRGGHISWPARSPDLTPMDFFLWGYVKDLVYQKIPTDAENMKERIRNAFQNISRNMLADVRTHHVQRLNLCITEHGRNFEHLF